MVDNKLKPEDAKLFFGYAVNEIINHLFALTLIKSYSRAPAHTA